MNLGVPQRPVVVEMTVKVGARKLEGLRALPGRHILYQLLACGHVVSGFPSHDQGRARRACAACYKAREGEGHGTPTIFDLEAFRAKYGGDAQ